MRWEIGDEHDTTTLQTDLNRIQKREQRLVDGVQLIQIGVSPAVTSSQQSFHALGLCIHISLPFLLQNTFNQSLIL